MPAGAPEAPAHALIVISAWPELTHESDGGSYGVRPAWALDDTRPRQAIAAKTPNRRFNECMCVLSSLRVGERMDANLASGRWIGGIHDPDGQLRGERNVKSARPNSVTPTSVVTGLAGAQAGLQESS